MKAKISLCVCAVIVHLYNHRVLWNILMNRERWRMCRLIQVFTVHIWHKGLFPALDEVLANPGPRPKQEKGPYDIRMLLYCTEPFLITSPLSQYNRYCLKGHKTLYYHHSALNITCSKWFCFILRNVNKWIMSLCRSSYYFIILIKV